MGQHSPVMYDYVRLANRRMEENLGRARELVAPLVAAYAEQCPAGPRPLRLIASGSSRHAALCARDFMQGSLHVAVEVVSPGRFAAWDADVPSSAFDVVISQSGYSTNAIGALCALARRGAQAVALTGCVDAPLASHAPVVVDYGVGLESIDFVTMGVLTLVEFLMLFSLHAARALGLLDDAGLVRGLAEVEDAIRSHGEALDVSRAFVERNRLSLARVAPTIVIGDGPGFGVAGEAALKLMETLKMPAMAFEGEEFAHGPSMQVAPGYRVFVIDDGTQGALHRLLAEEMARVTADTWLITCEPLGLPFAVPMPPVASAATAALVQLPFFQTYCALLAEELHAWDVHPFLAGPGETFAAKAAGYDERQESLKAQARLEWEREG